jgi:hypothetical protein
MRVVLALAAVALALVDRTASTSEAASRPNFLILFVVSFDQHGHHTAALQACNGNTSCASVTAPKMHPAAMLATAHT